MATLAQTIGSHTAQTPDIEPQQRDELAALEAHDATTSLADGNPSTSIDTRSPVNNITAPLTSSLPNETTSEPNAPVLHNFQDPPTTTRQTSEHRLAPSTLAQWVPSTNLAATALTSPGAIPSTPPEHVAKPIPEEQQSKSSEKETSRSPDADDCSAPDKIPQHKNLKASPSSSELEKEVDLEKGDGRIGSSSKTDVIATERIVPDANIVNWEGPDDPQNPMNWSSSLKWSNVAIISTITFLTYLCPPLDFLLIG